MSPLEAKNYGLIDEVIGGDEAGFQISGTTRDFPKTKESYVNWVRPCFLSFMLIMGHPDLHERIVCLERSHVLPELRCKCTRVRSNQSCICAAKGSVLASALMHFQCSCRPLALVKSCLL